MASESRGDYWQRVQKGLVQRLAIKGEGNTALAILNSELTGDWSYEDWGLNYYGIRVISQQIDFDYLQPNEENLQETINKILNGTVERCSSVTICLPLPELEDDWKDNLRSVLRGEKVVNQGVLVSPAPHEYEGLYFRSKTEIQISKALDKAQVVYFPLPVACYNRKHREPDFLVVSRSGKWDILEVQGEPYHPASTATRDHERARAFKRFGIPVEFYDADRCYSDPDGVVRDFLGVISKT